MNYEQLIAAGFTHEEALAYLSRNPQAAAADATSTRVPTPVKVGGAAAATLLGGYGIVQGAKRGVASATAKRQLRRAVNESEGGVQGLIQRIREFNATGRGADVTLSDLDPRLSAEADYVATNNPAARNQLSQLNSDRRRAMPQRMLGDVQRIAPGGYADAAGIQQGLQQEQQAFARGPEGYEGLRQANPSISPEGAGRLGQFLEDPRIQKTWTDAAAVGAVGPLPKADALSFEVLQGFRERLGSLKEKAWRQGDGDLGRRLNAAYEELSTILEEHIPGFAGVNARYSQYSRHQQAIETGQELWGNKTMQLPELERRIAGLPPEELQLVQKGMLGAYLADLENARKNSGYLETMMTQLPVQQKKLELVFGGREGFAQALQSYQQELAMARLGEVVGGSQTARRGAQQATTAAETMGDIAHVAASPMTGIPSVATKGVAKWMPGAVAERMSPAVTTRGSGALEDLLRTLMRIR